MYNDSKIDRLQEDIQKEKQKAKDKLDRLDSKIHVEQLKTEKKVTKLERERDVELKKAKLDDQIAFSLVLFLCSCQFSFRRHFDELIKIKRIQIGMNRFIRNHFMKTSQIN